MCLVCVCRSGKIKELFFESNSLCECAYIHEHSTYVCIMHVSTSSHISKYNFMYRKEYMHMYACITVMYVCMYVCIYIYMYECMNDYDHLRGEISIVRIVIIVVHPGLVYSHLGIHTYIHVTKRNLKIKKETWEVIIRWTLRWLPWWSSESIWFLVGTWPCVYVCKLQLYYHTNNHILPSKFKYTYYMHTSIHKNTYKHTHYIK